MLFGGGSFLGGGGSRLGRQESALLSLSLSLKLNLKRDKEPCQASTTLLLQMHFLWAKHAPLSLGSLFPLDLGGPTSLSSEQPLPT